MTEQVTVAQETQQDVRYHSCINEILALIKGRAPLIWVLTHEETRFIADFVEHVAEPHKRKMWLWSAYQGLIPQEQQMTIARASGEEKDTHNPQKALQRIAEISKGGDGIKGHCFILRDFHTVLGEPIPRQIRDIYDHLIGNGKTLIITSPELAHGPGGGKSGLPPTLEKQIAVVKYELPDSAKINDRIHEILNHMKESIKGKNKKTKLDYEGEEIQSFTKALQGLTMLEVDTSLSTSITHLNRLDVQKLINDKRQIIRKSQILEFIDAPVAMGDVGGLDLAKTYLSKYSKAYSDEAKKYGVEPLKGLLLTGVPGCLDGSTKILFNRGQRKSFREITLKNLYKRFNQIEDQYSWDPEIPTYLYSFDGESKLVKNRLIGIIDSGIKETTTVVVEDGSHITLTKDHPVCTSSGEFVPAGSLREGDKILFKGSMKPQFNGGKKLHLQPKRKTVETLKYYPNGNNHIVNGCEYQRTNYARLVIEAHMNSMSITEFIDILKHNAKRALELKFLDSKYDVHHIDENPQNDNIENLMILEHNAHAQVHSQTENFNVDYVKEVQVISNKDSGATQTYDVQMEYPHNNFVASNFIVHNTGKSLLAKAIGKMWKVPLLRLDVGKVMTGLVGGSEEKMRQVIDQAEAMAPCVLWIDEVEKSLSGTKSSNFSDGGTLARVFGTLLTAMQDGMEGVTMIATANDITMLPPEFIRRFNEVFFVDLPGPDERWEIFDIHLRKRGRSIKDFEKQKKLMLQASEDYTGAEIEKAIKDAIAAAFYADSKDVTIKEIQAALNDTKPISQVMKKKVDKLRETARGQYRYASTWAVEASKKREVKSSSGKTLDVGASIGDMKEFTTTPKSKAKAEKELSDNRFGEIVDEDVADETVDEKGDE